MNGKNGGGKQVRISLVVLIVAIVAAAAIGAVILISGQMKTKSYSETISSAEKHLAAREYEDAIIDYKKAISIDPEEEDAYLALADVYIEQNDASNARVILDTGFERTGSARIQFKLNQLQSGQLLLADFSKKEEQPVDLAIASVNIAWNTSFLQKLYAYTYSDYCEEFGGSGTATQDEDGYLEVVHSGLDGICYYRNTDENREIVDASRKTPEQAGMPEKVSLNSLSLLFRNFEGGVLLSRLQMLVGETVVPRVMDGRTIIELQMEECIVRIETDSDGNIVSANPWNEIVLLNANQSGNVAGKLSGVVQDAVNGNGVSGAKLTFEPQSSSAEKKTVNTDYMGAFSVELSPGSYMVRIEAEKYITEEFYFVMEDGKNYSGVTFVISPQLTSGEARIVLEWNSEPRDLDSYLSGTTDSGAAVNTNFTQPQAVSGGKKYAELDLDDIDGYGPETTTIYDLNGVYTFQVADFNQTGTMAQYGATVKVYLPGKAPETITLNSGSGVQDAWLVCEIDHGNLKVINGVPSGTSGGMGNK